MFIVTRLHHKNLPQNAAWKMINWSQMEKKFFFSNHCKKHRFQEYTDHWSRYQWYKIVLHTEQRLFMLLPTLISMIVLTETFFDIRNSFKVKSSLAKVNFLLKTNTLDVSTTKKVTNIIHKLNLIKIKLLALDKPWYFYNWYN